MLVLAIIGVGGVFTGTNPSYTASELSHHIKTSQSKFLISEPEIFAPVLIAANENGITDSNIWIFDTQGQKLPEGRRSWKDLFNHGEEDWVRFDDRNISQKVHAARLFSSGTTGLPKAVTITHLNLIAQHEMTSGAHAPPYDVSLSPQYWLVINLCANQVVFLH
jgi:acyl-CoA synthetase (AMP-forming)/AMP-acid ligase II